MTRALVALHPIMSASMIFTRLFILSAVLFSLIETTHAGTPDTWGNNADIYSLAVSPDSVPTGTYPTIIALIQNTSSTQNGSSGKAVFSVNAVITAPDKTQKTLAWNNINFTANQRVSFKSTNIYSTIKAGSYKVEYIVHDGTKKHIYSSLAKTFTVTPIAQVVSKPVATVSRERVRTQTQPKPELPRKEPAPEVKKPVEPPPQKPPEPITPPPLTEQRPERWEKAYEDNNLGIGGYMNTANYSAGASIIAWPFDDFALQGTYGTGTFTTYEVRLLYRLPLFRYVNPYLGAGYINAIRKAEVLGSDVTIGASGGSAFAGIEVTMPFYRRLSAYVDVAGNSLKFQKDIVSGTTSAIVKVKYSPTTVNVGLVWYIF